MFFKKSKKRFDVEYRDWSHFKDLEKYILNEIVQSQKDIIFQGFFFNF